MEGSVSIQNQIVDMSEWDFSAATAMSKAMETIKNRAARAIIMSAADERQVNKAIKCAREQSKRGLYFAVEVISSRSEEIDKAVQELMNEEGNFASQEYSMMSKKGEFGWTAAKARIVTNSSCIKDNVDKSITGKHWAKGADNKWLVDAVARGINREKEMTILEADGSKVSTQ